MDMDINVEDLREMFEVSKRDLEKGFREKDLGAIHDAAIGLSEITYMLDFFNVEI
ncbi:hypothetical protein C806_03995 [Lachnospiraceae bacterium 3-1]|nr:hypothetical protein C806_03995 [Lachnospiraceae bacterium 3-1]